MSEVIIAKSAGFCFGVRRAVEECYRQAQGGRPPVYTYGPIIHNEQVVEDLKKQGIGVLYDREELSAVTEGTVIIRSHGVGRDVCDQIRSQGLDLVDATCPFVRKIHRIVEEKTAQGVHVVIIGDHSHPEVQGICGWARGPVTVIGDEQEARAFSVPEGTPVCIVSQTTFNHTKFHKLVEIIRELRYDTTDILNTICSATQERQNEAADLARRADAMIVIGGKHSSNTQKLFDICSKECDRTFYVQQPVDLELRLLPTDGCIGITAGASTPHILIEEVSNLCRTKLLRNC